jgi:integrase
MSEKRVVVWVQHMADRPYLMLQWHDPDTGKRKSKSAETCNPIDAELKRADLEYELNHGTYQEASRMKWEKFRELFEVEYVSGRRHETRDNFTATFDAFERLCHPTTLRTITERTISAFVGALRREPGINGGRMMESSVKVRLQFLRTALNWAAGQKLIPECPTFPTIKVPKKKPQPVAVESFERMLAKAPDANMQGFLLCGWLAGMRLNEAIALEREETDRAPWLDLARDRIVFPAGFVKGCEDQWVPLDPELRQALEALPRRGKKVFRFTEGRSGKPVGDVAVSHRVIEVARLAGVRLTMKCLRRGFGCRYAGKVPAQVLQKLMRHSNISLTMAYYANVDDAVMDAVLGKQNNLPSWWRNSTRNRHPEPDTQAAAENDANLCPDAESEDF